MPKSMSEYLTHARRFERLASFIGNEQVKCLLKGQADACYRLALKKGREEAPPLPANAPSSA
jgi:hypothetical protein